MRGKLLFVLVKLVIFSLEPHRQVPGLSPQYEPERIWTQREVVHTDKLQNRFSSLYVCTE